MVAIDAKTEAMIEAAIGPLRARIDALEAERQEEMTIEELLDAIDDVFRRERWTLRPFYVVGGGQPA
jgi:hypothetical protein